MWSFGITLAELFTWGARPYGKWTNDKVLLELFDHGYRMPLPPRCPGSLYTIMVRCSHLSPTGLRFELLMQLSCWHPDQQSRPTFFDLQSRIAELMSNYQRKSVIDTELELRRLILVQKSFLTADVEVVGDF